MGFEKESSKGGGSYVGGFFQLFDWKAKSRKKLFSGKADFPEHSKQGKRNDGNLPKTRLHLMDEDEAGVPSSIRGGSDYSCASSVTDDDGYGARGPGVVARLMGLDSMPTFSFCQPNCTPYCETQSLRDVSHSRNHFDYYHDPQVIFSGNLLAKEDGGLSKNFVDSKSQKLLRRPIERFQTEVLPPKSAKSIPITHHKLLSPIKSPGFIPSKTPDYIMEAAAKIIEPCPQGSTKLKMPAVGSSSVPLKVRDLKEKLEVGQKMPMTTSSVSMRVRDLKERTEAAHRTSRLSEASQRPVESAKYLKGQPLNKSWNGSVDSTSFRSFPETDVGASGTKSKGTSISLAIQAKVNVQRREGLTSSSSQGLAFQKDSQGLASQKELNEVVSSQPFKSQPNYQKPLHKKTCTNNGSGVLRQNNQKQNCLIDKDKPSTKPTVANVHGKKVSTGNTSSGRHKTPVKPPVSKIASRKSGMEVTEREKVNSNYSKRNVLRKKRSIDGNLHVHKNPVGDNMLIDSDQKANLSNTTKDAQCSWAEESKRKGTDVVSFTFTAPLTRSVPTSDSSCQALLKDNGAMMGNHGKRLLLDTDSMNLSSGGYNMIGGDALNALLEQKLKDLTNSIESSARNSNKFASGPIFQGRTPTHNASSSASNLQNNKDNNVPSWDKMDARSYAPGLFSSDSAAFRLKHPFQGVDDMEECSSTFSDFRKLLDSRRPSPVSVLEPSFSTESGSSLDSADSIIMEEGSNLSSSVQAQEVIGLHSSKKFHYVDAEMELSDSASSTSTGIAGSNLSSSVQAQTSIFTDIPWSTNWEAEYVTDILSNLETMFQGFAIGQASVVINPILFDHLEHRKDGLLCDNAEARLERKLLFDCVGECMDLRCKQYVGGGYKNWVKGLSAIRRKEQLVEEVQKEISAWRDMGDCLVDELVDKDMSSQYGRWLDFKINAFELGAEVANQILNSLVDEVCADILLL